jgi:hypothetical protein
MITFYAILLSLTEAFSQMMLKQSRLAQGVFGYCCVASILYLSYLGGGGITLSGMQLSWSIVSSMLAMVQGSLIFGEPVHLYIVPFLFLVCAQLWLAF